MARERCNLDKDEAELLKPSSSPPSPPATSTPSPPQPSSSSSSSSPPSPPPPQLVVTLKPLSGQVFQTQKHQRSPPASASAAALASSTEPPRQPAPLANRCWSCRKRVGLTGFRCRCGDLFCHRHRYSDAHDCSFDYKAAGREQISKANPLIRPAKIVKI